jgi:hypothetical protein
VWHLGAARRFAQECVDLEKLSDPASAEALVHYCAGAVILSCAAIEAYGNELLYAAETDKKKAKKPVRKRSRERRESEALANFAVALPDRGTPLDATTKEYAEASALIEARNALVHHWPEWTDEKDEHAKIASLLRGKFPLHPSIADPKAAHFPENFMAAGMAGWAYETAEAFLEWVAKAAGEERKFE